MLSRIPRSITRINRFYSTARPHPLASTPSPRGPIPSGKSRLAPKHQKWSTLTAVLLATITGTTTYVVGLKSNSPVAAGGASQYKDPTRKAFDEAMIGLRQVLPEDSIATDRDSLLAHGSSAWSYHDPEGLPGAVLYPRSTEDVVAIVKLAALHSIPIIPYSGGTALEGQTEPITYPSNHEEDVVTAKRAKGEKVVVEDTVPGLSWVLDFAENMNQIIKVNADDLDCIVQPGVSYNALNDTLKEDGIPLFFPVDPAPGAMIGGMVGTGASGTNAVRYGTMRENVLNLTVVLPSGEVIKTRQRAKKSSAGPDLTKLFIGSEGTFGIVVEATLKLSPLLPSKVAVSSFPTIEAAALAVRDIVQQGIQVACVELLDDVMVKAINKKGGGIVWEEKPSLFIKFSGTENQMKGDVENTRKITSARKGSKLIFSRNDKEAEDIWYSRKVALWSAIDYLEGAKCWTTDVCVPISNFPQLVAETKEDLAKEGIVGPIVGHAGDGNFHALLLYRTDEEFEKVKGLVDRMVRRAQRLDGTCTGEHGVGTGKMSHLEDELGKGTVDLLRSIKHLIDPANLFNPGKLIPGALPGRVESH